MNEMNSLYIRRQLTLDPGTFGPKWCIAKANGARNSRWYDTRQEAYDAWKRRTA